MTKSILQMANEDIKKERTVEAKELLKSVLKQLQTAQTIVDNLERELVDLEKKIDQGNF